jgi:hypothetical protein
VNGVIPDSGIALRLKAQQIEIVNLVCEAAERVIKALLRSEVDVFAAREVREL